MRRDRLITTYLGTSKAIGTGTAGWLGIQYLHPCLGIQPCYESWMLIPDRKKLILVPGVKKHQILNPRFRIHHIFIKSLRSGLGSRILESFS